jgi:hypothetical protein
LGIDEFVLEGLQEVVVQLEAGFESAVREPPLALEQIVYLGQEFVEGHGFPPCGVPSSGV